MRFSAFACAVLLFATPAHALTISGGETGAVTGLMTAGQSFSVAIPKTSMTFNMLPIAGGWTMSVTSGVANCGNLAAINPVETLNLLPPANYTVAMAGSLPPQRSISFAQSCDDLAVMVKANECKADTTQKRCSDTGAYAVGRVTLDITSQQIRPATPGRPDTKPIFVQITFTVTGYAPEPAANNP